jgi:hypothetical protein
LTPGCTGPNGETLALAVAEDGSIVVQDASEITESLVWSLIYDIPSGNFAMVNADSVAGGSPAVLGLQSEGGATTPLTLTTLDSGGLAAAILWDVAAGGTALAVRSGVSTSLNLNVAGTGPYPPGSAVIAYDGWGGGQPNEIWTFEQMGVGDYPWNYTFAPENAPGTLLTANPEDAGGQLTIEPPNGGDAEAGPAQLWAANYFIAGTTAVGVILSNEELSMVMRTTPGGGAVFAVDPTDVDAWSTWVVGPAPDPQAYRLGPAGNPVLALNVSGGGSAPGTGVITYGWQGGAENEQWVPTFVPHEVT